MLVDSEFKNHLFSLDGWHSANGLCVLFCRHWGPVAGYCWSKVGHICSIFVLSCVILYTQLSFLVMSIFHRTSCRLANMSDTGVEAEFIIQKACFRGKVAHYLDDRI